MARRCSRPSRRTLRGHALDPDVASATLARRQPEDTKGCVAALRFAPVRSYAKNCVRTRSPLRCAATLASPPLALQGGFFTAFLRRFQALFFDFPTRFRRVFTLLPTFLISLHRHLKTSTIRHSLPRHHIPHLTPHNRPHCWSLSPTTSALCSASVPTGIAVRTERSGTSLFRRPSMSRHLTEKPPGELT